MNTAVATNPRAAIGDNAPPDAFETIQNRTNELVANANAWLKAVTEITDADTASSCDSFLAQVKAEAKAAEEERRRQKKPHEDAAKAVDARFKPLTLMLEKIEQLLKPLKTGWLKREQQRLADEQRAKDDAALKALQEAEALKATPVETIEQAVEVEQAQEKAKEAVKAAVDAAAAKPRVHGDLAPRASSLRTYWSAEITDYTKALLHYGEQPSVRAEIQRLADADARSKKQLLVVPGVKAISEQRA